MLTMTETATTVVKNIAVQSTGTETGGLRISGNEAGPTDFTVSVANEPQQGDQVVESEGARVFLEEQVATVLDDKVLDAQVEGDGSVRFALANQA